MSPPIVFFGTPHFAAEVLSALIDAEVPILGIVTQPDRPKGRSLQVTASPVKEVAKKKLPGVPIFQPERCSEEEFLSAIAQLDAALYVVVAFGQILPQKLLDIPKLGAINVHASLLPRYRGAAPIHRCLMNGDEVTGVSIQKMVKKLDAGDVIAEAKLKIGPDMTFGELEQALCRLSQPTLLNVLHAYLKGIPKAEPQDEKLVSFAAKVEPEEGRIDWEKPAQQIHNQVRAFSPRPGAWTTVQMGTDLKRMKIFKTRLREESGKAGELIIGKELILACGSQAIEIEELQIEGKPRMKGADWLRGVKSRTVFK